METLTYPVTPTVDVVDDYHGTPVPDPYRWLEDLDGERTAAWVRDQNELTRRVLDALPGLDALRTRLTELWSQDDIGIPWRKGDRVFQSRRPAGSNQAVLIERRDDGSGERVVLDPNTWSEDGTVALTGLSASDDGRLLAYGVSEGGSDRQVWRILDVETGTVLDDELRDVKFTLPAWLPDGSGLFYGHFPAGTEDFAGVNSGQHLMLHRVGTAQEDDEVVMYDPDNPNLLYMTRVTSDGSWLVISVARGSDDVNEIHLKALTAPDGPIRPLFTGFDAAYSFVRNDGPRFTFMTNAGAPRGRVITVDQAAPSATEEIIATSDATLLSAAAVGGKLIAHYLRDAASEVTVHALDGTLERRVPLPGLGTAAGFSGEEDHSDTYFSFQSTARPPTIYRYDIARGAAKVLDTNRVPFDPDAFITERLIATSADGTRFPIFVTRHADVTPSPDTPALLYGYGGFNVSVTPTFAKTMIPWLEAGGIFATACLRGGGEYGEEWHQAGTKERKQNVFDDFIAAAEHLIAEGMTSPERLAIQGGSNGGLLVGACILQRPDLFRAANAAVGVFDMLRYHRFTIGWAWSDDYGTADDPDQFRTLVTYSPLHNVAPGEYPALIITTGDHDDRVVPAHSFKFAATLQPAQRGPAPILLRVDVRAGHGMGKPVHKIIDASADVFAFLMDQVGLEPLTTGR